MQEEAPYAINGDLSQAKPHHVCKSEYQACCGNTSVMHTNVARSNTALTGRKESFQAPLSKKAAVTNNASTVNENQATAVKVQESNTSTSNVMQITKCPHVNRKHYAKNMCSSCYRKHGRNQTAWACEHTDKPLYSMGMCQTCYLADYHKKRTALKKQKELERKEEAQRKRVLIQEHLNEVEVHEHDITN